MEKNFQDLLQNFNRVSLASEKHSQEILELSENIQMQTESGGLKFDRNPDFFALSKIQGEKTYTFLFRNSDNSLTGYGCVSITPMMIKGQKEYLGYTSDLRFSPNMEKETKIQFYQFYELLIKEFKNISELSSCQYIIASILDGNVAAKKVMVDKRGQNKGHLIHRPFYSYSNINVIGSLPLHKINHNIVRAQEKDHEEIINFLTTDSNQNISWTEDEILRRKRVHQFSWSDFLLFRDENHKITACCALLSDYLYRKAKVSQLTLGIKLSQMLAYFLGKPKVTENEPLRLGYISFLKIQSNNLNDRTTYLSQFFNFINCLQRTLPKDERYHSITVHEPSHYNMGKRLLKKGHINVELPATLYQVIHESELREDNQLITQTERPDFDIVFH